jgi:hypothetical protein
MSRYMVIHTAPFTPEELIARAKAAPGYMPKGVTWICSYCDFHSNRHFCEWEAPDEHILRRVLDLTKSPFDAIHPVRRLDIARAEFEA